jgi:hypothetical protein
MIHSYLIKLPQGETEIAKQTMQRFPLGWEAEDTNRAAKDSAALHKVITAIELASQEECHSTSEVDKTIQHILCGIALDAPVIYNSNNLKKIIKAISQADENNFEAAFGELRNYLYENAIIESPTFNFAVLKAIYQFRNYLEPRGVINIGKQFNTGLLGEAYKLYDEKFLHFGSSHSAKNMLFRKKVIGYIQRFSPASYAQAFAQGIYYIVENGEKLKRSLKFRYDKKNILFFPLDSDPRFRLGHDCVNPSIWWHAYFSKLCQAKTTSLQSIMQQRDNHSASWCSIM